MRKDDFNEEDKFLAKIRGCVDSLSIRKREIIKYLNNNYCNCCFLKKFIINSVAIEDSCFTSTKEYVHKNCNECENYCAILHSICEDVQ